MNVRHAMTTGGFGWLKTITVTVIAALLAFGSLTGTVMAKSRATSDGYNLSSGSVVEWADPWVLDERSSGYSADSAGDVVTLLNGETARFVLATYPGIVTPQDGRDGLIAQYEKTRDDVVEVDADEDKTSAFGLVAFTGDDGGTWGSYSSWSISADGQTLVSLELTAPIDDIESIVADAQQGIAVDGVTVLPDADGVALADALASGKSAKSKTKSKTSTTKGSTTSKSKSKTKTSKTPAIDPAFEEAGLIDEVSYESPQFGYTVAWEQPWTVNPDDDEAVVSDTAGGTDALYIATDDPSYALVSVFGMASDGSRPADVTATWASQDFLDKYTGEGTVVLLEDSNRSGGSVVTYGPLQSDASVEIVTVREVVSFDGGDTLVLLTLIAPVETFAEIYDNVQEAIVVDGGAGLGYFTTDEIVNEMP